MRKTARKLVLRSEALRTLTNMDLVRVIGGIDSGDNQYLQAWQTGDKQCDAPAFAIAIANCR
jgi:hypothetical protein